MTRTFYQLALTTKSCRLHSCSSVVGFLLWIIHRLRYPKLETNKRQRYLFAHRGEQRNIFFITFSIKNLMLQKKRRKRKNETMLSLPLLPRLSNWVDKIKIDSINSILHTTIPYGNRLVIFNTGWIVLGKFELGNDKRLVILKGYNLVLVSFRKRRKRLKRFTDGKTLELAVIIN